MQSELTFYRDPANPLSGTTPSVPWKAAGNAFTASSINIYPSSRRLVSAKWYVVWAPMANGTYNGVRLAIKRDLLPENAATEQQIGYIGRNAGSTPMVDSVDITNDLNSLLDELASNGVSHYQLIMRTAGDSSSRIYRSTIDLVWGE